MKSEKDALQRKLENEIMTLEHLAEQLTEIREAIVNGRELNPGQQYLLDNHTFH